VVFVASIAPTLAHFVSPVALALQAQGWEAIAVASGAGSLRGFDRAYDLPPFRRKGLWAHLVAFRALRQVLLREAPDVVHLHTPSAVALGRLAAASAGVPSISVVHGTLLEPRSRRSALFVLAEAPFAWISSRTVVVNRDDARFYRRICRRGSVQQAPAGGAGVAVLAAGASAPSSPNALYLGRMAVDKNLDFLVEAWKEARQRIPNLTLRFVGGSLEGDPAWTPPDLDGIEHEGWSDPSIEIDRARVLVVASRREGFSLVVAEAICAGIPVVAVENRGTREIARQVQSGLTVVPFDTARFADALVEAEHCHKRHPRPDLLARWGTEATVTFHLGVIIDCLERRVAGERRPADRTRAS
jgi:glycosyltransferase involved in cell wall biosynthesis